MWINQDVAGRLIEVVKIVFSSCAVNLDLQFNKT